MSFHYRGMECKSRKSRNTWSNRQIWSWNTEWSRTKANRILPREHTGHSKHPLPTTQPGADCGSDHELLIAKFRLKLKKVGKTSRPFRYDLNQISSDYTVEVRNRFKGLDLIDRVPDELWADSWHWTGDREQDHPQEKEMQKSKMAVWGGLTNSCEKKRSEKQRRKGKIYPFECSSKE